MTILMVLLPIILLFIFFLIFLTVSKGMKLKKFFWTFKRIRVVVLSYIGIGLFAFIYLYFTGNDGYHVLSKEEVQQIEKDEKQFYHFMSLQQEDKFTEKYLVNEWSMELSSDEVTFVRESEDTYGRVFVVINWRNDAKSNEIYAKTYQLPYIYRGINLTNELTKNQFEFTDNKLIVKRPLELNFTFNKVIPKVEMLEMNLPTLNSINDVVDNSATGSTFLYLNVPTHVTIIDEGKLRFYP